MRKSFQLKVRAGVVKTAVRAVSGTSRGKTRAALPKTTGTVLKMLKHGKVKAVSPTVNRTHKNLSGKEK
jgi:hypothetical protein